TFVASSSSATFTLSLHDALPIFIFIGLVRSLGFNFLIIKNTFCCTRNSRAYTTWGNCSFHITKEEGVLIWLESSINNFFGIFIFCFQFIFIFFTIIFIEPWHDVILYRIWSAFDFSVI